jgi:hypothetical protein
MKKIINTILLGGVFAIMALSGCTDAVEKTDLGRVTDDAVWKDPRLIRGYFNNTMYAAMPGSEVRLLGHADECFKRESGITVVYDNFGINADGGGGWENVDRWPYETIRKINRFLDHAGYEDFVSLQPITSALPQAEKEDMIGHMLVLRAYHYFDLVRTYGGVPLLLHEQEFSTDFETLYTSRSKTSECVAQIIKDLDAAIALPDASFPMKRSDGHIGKGVAYALKGRVLLYYASPQFTKQTPAGTKSAEQRWNEAYAACKEAYDKLTAAGFGLYAPDGGNRQTVMANYYKMLVTEEMNKEMIWVRRYEPLVYNFGDDKGLRPGSSSGQTIGPVWEMACAFANADGTPFTAVQIDNSRTGGFGDMIQGVVDKDNIVPDGSAINTSVFWLDREPRFYAFLGYNGCEYPLIRKAQADFSSDVAGGKLQHEWLFYWGNANNIDPFDKAYDPNSNDKGKGFAIRKFVRDDRNYELPGNAEPLKECGTDWPLFRFAEVMLNLAEAAVKTNKPQEAYDMLDAIRKRAGIPEGGNHYGLGRKTGDALILDILNERRIELFIESKRYYDVRRWRLYSDALAGFKLNGTRRHTLIACLKDMSIAGSKPAMISKLQGILDAGGIDTQAGRDAYFDVFFHTVMLYDYEDIHYNPDRQDFLRIPYANHIMKNPTIEQTIGWSDERGPGTFNPYE